MNTFNEECQINFYTGCRTVFKFRIQKPFCVVTLAYFAGVTGTFPSGFSPPVCSTWIFPARSFPADFFPGGYFPLRFFSARSFPLLFSPRWNAARHLFKQGNILRVISHRLELVWFGLVQFGLALCILAWLDVFWFGLFSFG